ncbi:MAG: SpoIIIAH-like family protein, partial [Lachnospiraceae bacterium]|nr:SpoIIIAH-like family protein [Lachnospiraceae bacterium]
MKKLFRKNQIIITALALLIAVAGYVSYTQTNTAEDAVETAAEEAAATYEISDEDTVAEIFTDTEEDAETAAADAEISDGTEVAAADTDGTADDSGTDIAATEDSSQDDGTADGSDAGETVLTSAESTVDFAAEVKLNREQVRSKNKETLQEIIDSTSLSEAQKQEAVDALVAMTDVAERENAAEILLAAKGFSNVVVSITDDTADVVLDMGDVTDAKRAQVEDIVKRKTGISAENIVITPI